MKALFMIAAVLALSACTDATRAHIGQYNDPAHVQCFSGGQVIYDGHSTGKIESNSQEDGLYFREKESGEFIRLYADCIVKSP